MADVTVELPSLLRRVVDVPGSVEVKADSLAGALAVLVKQHPALKVHLFDEGGGLRQHVLCFHNDRNTRWMETMDAPLRDGDRITILQAVSGG